MLYLLPDSECFGPAHLGAVKAGLTDITHDVGHIYFTINAKTQHWLQIKEDEWTAVNAINQRCVFGRAKSDVVLI